MALWQCPGQDRRYWKPEDIFEEPCPHCGNPIEFWKDDVRVRCPNCKELVTNPRFDPGCAAWCSYADKCLGPMAAEFRRQPQVIRDRLEVEVRKELAGEKAVLDRSLKAAAIARDLAREKGADMVVAVAASLLYGLAATGRREKAEDLLVRVGIDQEVREQIMNIITSLPDTPNGSGSENLTAVAEALSLAAGEGQQDSGHTGQPWPRVAASR